MELEDKIAKELNNYQDPEVRSLSPTLLAALAGIFTLVAKEVVARCTEQNPFEVVANGLNNPDPVKRHKAEQIIRTKIYQKAGKHPDLKNTPLSAHYPDIGLNVLKAVSDDADEDERLNFVLEQTYKFL